MKRLIKNKKPHVRVSSVLTFTNLTEEQKGIIIDDLTYPNPAYENAMRFSGYDSVLIPETLEYYCDDDKRLYTPVGYDYSKIGVRSVCDTRNRTTITPPDFKLTLRDTQREAAEAFIRCNKGHGKQCGLIQMPTGKGKSILGLYLAGALRQKTLVLVHKTDLVNGWKADAQKCYGDDIDVGVLGGGVSKKKQKIGDFITIATVQTLNKYSDEQLEEIESEFGFIIIDEAHHTPASSYDLINCFNARYKMGLTATPEREDGLIDIMNAYLGDFCYMYKAPKYEDDKDILPVRVLVRKPATEFDPVCKPRKLSDGKIKYEIYKLSPDEKFKLTDGMKRYSELRPNERPNVQTSDLYDTVVQSKSFLPLVVNDIKKEAENGKSCVVFFNHKVHCSLYYHRLIRAGVPEELIQIYNGDFTKRQLEECIRKAESREALITLTTFSKSTEGTNVKAWEVLFMVGSVNNGKSAEQAVGRVRRVSDNKAPIATVYDYYLQKIPRLARHFNTRVQRYQKLGFQISRFAQKAKKIK